jgi:DNA-binding FadR family transcriptional regulator
MATAPRLAFALDRVHTAPEQVVAQLKRAILSRQLRPGDRLPPESELAARFGVGRQVLREALKVLAANNLITSNRGRDGGTFVVHPGTEIVARSLAEALQMMLDLDNMSLAEIVEARQVIEVACARIASQRRTPEDLEAIRQALERASAERISAEEWLDLDVVFHKAEAAAGHNRVLALPLVAMHAVVQPGLNRLIYHLLDPQAVVAQHREIYEAIRDRDPDRAERMVLRHLDYLRELYRQLSIPGIEDASPPSARDLMTETSPQESAGKTPPTRLRQRSGRRSEAGSVSRK